MKKSIVLFLLSMVILFPVIFPLFTSYVPGTADGFAHKFRLISFEKSLSEGYLRPRWLADQGLGHGAPVFLFNYLTPYYAIAGIHQLMHSVNLSVQIYQALTLIVSFAGMYLCASRLHGRWGGIAAAAVYTWAPYHLLSVYLYEGWGEMTSFMWPPIILLLQMKNEKRKMKKEIPLIFVWFLFILSHNVSVLMFAPVLVGVGIIERRSRGARWIRGISEVSLPFFIAVFLSAFFWLPAVSMNSLTEYPQLIAKEMGMRGSYFKSLAIHWDVGYDTIVKEQAFFWDFTIGVALAAGVVAAVGVLLSRVPTSPKVLRDNVLILSLLVIVFLAMFLSNYASDALWNIRMLQFVVYPFRFLFVAVFAASLLVGWVAKNHWSIAAVFVVLACIAGRAYLHPYVTIFPYDEQYFYQPQTFEHPPGNKHNMGTGEFLPKGASTDYLIRMDGEYAATKKLPEKMVMTSGKATIENQKAEYLKAVIDVPQSAAVTIRTLYFPNWLAYVDGTQVSAGKDFNGLMVIQVPQGRHTLELVFGTSGVEKVGWGITTMGALMTAGYLLNEKFKMKK